MARTQVSPTASIDREEVVQAAKKEKTRRPPNNAFRQQRLKAWQPILTPKSLLPIFFAIGAIFAPIGGLLLWTSNKVQDISIEYTNCRTTAPNSTDFGPISSGAVSSSFKSSNAATNVMWRHEMQNVSYGPNVTIDTSVCFLQFDLPNTLDAPVLLYYRLSKFYQNHRRYVKSLDQDQLEGTARNNKSIQGSYCDPLKLDDNGFAYYPCGLIANSMFNDTFFSPQRIDGGDNPTYDMTNAGIAWSSDADLFKPTAYTVDQVVPPPNWVKRYPGGRYNNEYSEYNLPNLQTWEEFQVWMRTAGLPTFSKLALRNDSTAMQAGTYQIRIEDNFFVDLFGGKKELLISTRTVLGGRNPFLGIAYIVVGGICIVLGAIFLAMYLIKPRKLGDHTYLTWNNEPTSATTTTGRNVRPNDAA